MSKKTLDRSLPIDELIGKVDAMLKRPTMDVDQSLKSILNYEKKAAEEWLYRSLSQKAMIALAHPEETDLADDVLFESVDHMLGYMDSSELKALRAWLKVKIRIVNGLKA